MRRAVVLVVMLVGCIPQGSGQQELRTRVPGTWVGTTPDGVKLTMHLAPDGSGEVNGHAGSWEIKIGRILLSDGDHMVPCDLEGDELNCHTPDGDLVMTRSKPSDEVAAAAPEVPTTSDAPPKPFAPEKTVPGQPFLAPANGPISGASFTTPDGWAHGGGKMKTYDVHLLARPDGPTDETILIARLPAATGDALAKAMEDFVIGHGEMLLEPETIDVAGQQAARAILKAEGVEYYAATVRGKDAIFVIVGSYPPDQAEAMRPVVETVLSSFRTSP